MAITNTHDSYGSVTRTLHWLTALLIFIAIPLGFIGSDLALEIRAPGGAADPSQAAQAKLIFSLHKTIGIMAFWVALLRILWALIQPQPGLIKGDHRLEAFAAEVTHYLLYGSMLLVPLSGWVHHAATSGFAPIWWPFGQDLLFIPKSDSVAQIARALHDMGKNLLIAAILLHIAGAFKHQFIDRDATMRRMLSDMPNATASAEQPGQLLPATIAAAILVIVFGGTALLSGEEGHDPGEQSHSEQSHNEGGQNHAQTAAPASGNWQVETGDLSIGITQMGSAVTGRFADWQADITYTPGPDGKRGTIAVTIPIASLQLGSVSDQAMGADYFDAATFPTATVTADLIQSGNTLTAQGTLTIKGQSVPVSFPVDLSLSGDKATAKGQLSINRMDFGIGSSVTDQDTLADAVTVNFDLTANRTGE